jgi:Tol biopolymer transport system component
MEPKHTAFGHLLDTRAAQALLGAALVAAAIVIAGCGGGGGDEVAPTSRASPTFTSVYAVRQTNGATELRRSVSGDLLAVLDGGLHDTRSLVLTPDQRSALVFGSPTSADPEAIYRLDFARPNVLVPLSQAPSGSGRVTGFEMSPDGLWVVYSGDLDTDGVQEIYLAAVDGSEARKINGSVGSPPRVDLKLPQTAWSPDSRLVLQLVRNLSDGRVIGINQTDITVGGGNSTRRYTIGSTESLAFIQDASWTPDSAGIVFAARPTDAVDRVDLFAQMTPGGPLSGLAGPILDFVAGPPAGRVLFRRDLGQGQSNLSIENLSTPSVVHGAITSTGRVEPGYQFSPDGSAAVFIADQGTGVFNLYSVNLSTPEPPTQLNGPMPASTNVQQATFTPDGSRVVYRTASTFGLAANRESDLNVVDPALPGRSTRLNGREAAGGGVGSDFAVALDGSSVAYRGDLLLNEHTEFFFTPLASPGESIGLSAPIDTNREVSAFGLR